jgi:hypothetical protein
MQGIALQAMLNGADGKSCNANGWQAMRLANLRNVIWQSMVVLHRYLGVAVGLLMVMWFVSGIVMMYVGLPDVIEDEGLGPWSRSHGRPAVDSRSDWRPMMPRYWQLLHDQRRERQCPAILRVS